MQRPLHGVQHVLIIDDDPYIVNFLAMFFQRKGWITATALDWKTASRLLTHNPFDVIVVDLNLQNQKGTDLIPGMRQIHPDIPVVVLTGHGYQEPLMQEALRQGANAFVSKSLPPDELFVAVTRAIGNVHKKKSTLSVPSLPQIP
jgi:DNA-binding NtrC family response regulator